MNSFGQASLRVSTEMRIGRFLNTWEYVMFLNRMDEGMEER